MDWQELEKKTRSRITAPTVAIDKAGLYMNRAAAELVGKDMGAVRLFFAEDEGVPYLGMWFFKTKEDTDKPWRAYALVHYDSGIAKISCSKFVDSYGLLQIKRRLGKTSFLIALDKGEMTGGAFYRVKLQ